MKLAACMLLLSSSWTLADEPKDLPTSTPSSTPAPAPSPSPSPALAPAPASAATADAATATSPPAKKDTSEIVNIADTEALIKRMRGRGYKPINRNGILVFCRSEGQLGTHFERTRCNTIDELKNAELTGQEYAKHIQQQGSPTPFNP